MATDRVLKRTPQYTVGRDQYGYWFELEVERGVRMYADGDSVKSVAAEAEHEIKMKKADGSYHVGSW